MEGRFCGACGSSLDAAPSRQVMPAMPAPVRKSAPVMPAVNASVAVAAGDVSRPGDATGLVHRFESPVGLAAIVVVKDEDTFYGVVQKDGKRSVAFALMTGVRATPDACEGYFVSRGMEGVDLDHEIGDVASADGRHAIVRVRGQLALKVADPIELLVSDAPLDDEALSARVIGAFVDALEGAVREGLEEEELTLESIVDGGADARLLDRVTGERGAAKALRALGLVVEVGALHVEGEMVSAPIGGVSATQERTMPEATFVSRDGDADGPLSVHAQALPVGTIVTVDVGDAFVCVGADGTTRVFPTGRHRIDEAGVGGAFVRQKKQELRFGVPLGHVRDFKGSEGELRAYGTLDLTIDDAGAAIAGLAPLAEVEPETLVDRVRAAAADSLGGVIRDGLGGGEWDLSSVGDDAEIDEACRRAARAYANVDHRVPGTSIVFRDLHVSVGASTAAAPRTMESEPPEPVDDEFEKTALPIMQYPPPEASERTAKRNAPAAGRPPTPAPVRLEDTPDFGPNGPDSVMPTAVTDAGYAQRVLEEAGLQPGREAGLHPGQPRTAPADASAAAALVSSRDAVPRSQVGIAKPASIPRPDPVASAAASAQMEKSFTQPTPSPFEPPRFEPPRMEPPRPVEPPKPMVPATSPAAIVAQPMQVVQPPVQPAPAAVMPPIVQAAAVAEPTPPPAAAAAAGGFSVGTYVFVMWSDGNRYPGQVQQTSPDHCLVLFSNGHQQWVPMHALSPAL
jgi:hypothetical protein